MYLSQYTSDDFKNTYLFSDEKRKRGVEGPRRIWSYFFIEKDRN